MKTSCNSFQVEGKYAKIGFQFFLAIGWLLATLLPAKAAIGNLADLIIHTPLSPQPLVWVGSQLPPMAESQELLNDIDLFKTNGVEAGFAALEQFVLTNPQSPWTPSLQLHLADHDRSSGRYAEALAYWQAVWAETKDRQDSKGQKLAVQAITEWTRLLASLGQKEQIETLFAELAARHLPLGAFRTTIEETKEGLVMMNTQPGKSYRCGSFALGHLALTLGLNRQVVDKLLETDSPDGGFTMSQLLALAKTNGMAVAAARWPVGAQLVVPSVVHWKLNHYAAITEQKGDLYRVDDPTFGGHIWMTADAIEAESSGDYILPADKVPASWEKLSNAASAKIYGKGYPNRINDPQDYGPQECSPDGTPDSEDSSCDPPSANDGTGSGGVPPPPCCGMPQWHVSEPYINLWLKDTPLLYHESDQRWMRLEVSYKSRGESQNPSLPSFGDDWGCNWIGRLFQSTNTDVIVDYLAGGGEANYLTNGALEYKTARRFQSVTAAYGDPPALILPRGAMNVYDYTNAYLDGSVDYLLTERLDRYGRILERFNYQNVGGVIQLTSMVDMDGRTNTLSYSGNLITSVTDPYGQTAYFGYTNENGINLLTSIKDAQGIITTFQYDTNYSVSTMTTLYGTTTFQSTDCLDTNNLNAVERSELVTEASGDQQLYVYLDHQTNDPTGFFDMSSYHWNRAQYAGIGGDWQTYGFAMPPADYESATLKHWLHGDPYKPGGLTVSDTLDLMEDPYDPVLQQRSNFTGFNYEGESGNYIGESTNGALQCLTDMSVNGNTLFVITRNSLGLPTSYTLFNSDNTHATYTNVYDSSGAILQYELGPEGELTRGYGYASGLNNLLTSVTNAVGDVIHYTHDPTTLKVTSVIFPGGLVCNNVYYTNGPSKGFLAMQADIGFRTNYFGYFDGNLVVLTNELGLVTTYTYDNLNRLLTTTYPDATTTENVYDKMDLVATKDRLGHWTYYHYNPVRQLDEMTNADSQLTTFSYCGCGSPDAITRWNGAAPLETQLSYNIDGWLTNALYPDNYHLSCTYDAQGRVSSISDSDGHQLQVTAWYEHGLQSQPQTVTLGGVQLWTRLFDEYGRAIQSTDRNSVTTTNGYDFLDRLFARQSFGSDGTPSGLESFGYSALGLTNYLDPLGHPTVFVRDASGRVLYETNANNEVLQFTYNPADELATLTDGKDQTTTWNYDIFGRVTNKVDNAGTTDFVYQYDLDDRLTSRWTPAKGTTVYRYDPLGNLTNVDYSGGTVATPSLYFAYDGVNRLTNMVDGLGATAFGWTDGDQLSSETGPWANDAVNYTYDFNSRQLVSLNLQQPNADPWTQSYTYDALFRLTDVVSPAGHFAYVPYSGGSDLVQGLWFPGPNQSENFGNSYDSLARLTHSYLNTTLYYKQLAYAYDAGSEVTQQVFTVGTVENNFSLIYNYNNYTYDAISQLKTAQGLESDGTTPRLQEQFGYAYDKAWNLNYRTNNALIQNFAVNNVNELSGASRSGTLTVAGTAGELNGNGPYDYNPGVTSVTVNGQNAAVYGDGTFAATNFTPANGWNTYTAIAQDTYGRKSTNTVTAYLPASPSYNYDANGNLTNDGTRNFAYDDENQLIAVWEANAWSNNYAYDGLLRRRIEKDYSWNGSSWIETNETHFIYDGYLVIQERDGNNLPVTTYTRGNDLSGTLQGAGGIGGLLGRTENAKLLIGDRLASAYYFNDAQGNVSALIYSNSMLAADYKYDPYGNMISMSGTLANANKYRFSSKEWNDNTGLYYYGFRFYDPNLQRWPNRDPVQEYGGINLFELVHNNPMRYVDSLGFDYGVCYVTVYGVFPHQVVLGDDGKGGSYSIEYGPVSHTIGNMLNGPGKYSYSDYSHLSLNQLAQGYGGLRSTYQTTQPVDKQLNAIAESLEQNNNTPNYSVCGNNCMSVAPMFNSLANNLTQYRTPYPPMNVNQNAPPSVVTSPNCNCQ